MNSDISPLDIVKLEHFMDIQGNIKFLVEFGNLMDTQGYFKLFLLNLKI